jgi:large subunit ribosomal protein L21
MFAVLKTGGKQYKVAVNDVVTLEKLPAEAGAAIEFDTVLMLGGETVTVGAPFVEGAAVKAEVLEQMLGPKVISFKKRRRKHSSQRKRGHRQHLTRVRITEIVAAGKTATSKARPAADAAPEADTAAN